MAQSSHHTDKVKSKSTYHNGGLGRWFTRLDIGFAPSYLKPDPHYMSSPSASTGLTLGLMEEIPILKHANLLIGGEWVKDKISFDSYYFAPGITPLYIPNQFNYQHDLTLDELQFPLEYKFAFSNNPKKVKTIYATAGFIYRLLIYRNATVYNANNGEFIWQGQNDVTYSSHLFTNTGSEILELGIGYQHNALKTGRGYFLEIQYKYGISPFNYTVNNYTSFNMTFGINTLSFKFGIRF